MSRYGRRRMQRSNSFRIKVEHTAAEFAWVMQRLDWDVPSATLADRGRQLALEFPSEIVVEAAEMMVDAAPRPAPRFPTLGQMRALCRAIIAERKRVNGAWTSRVLAYLDGNGGSGPRAREPVAAPMVALGLDGSGKGDAR
jgi:hypothetical protein